MAEEQQLTDIDSLIKRIKNYDFNGITGDIISFSNSQTITIQSKIEYIEKIIIATTNLLKLEENVQNKITGMPPPPKDIINLTSVVCECFRTYDKLCTGGPSVQNKILANNSTPLLKHINILFDTFDLAVEHFSKIEKQVENVFDKISIKMQCTIGVIWQFLLNVCVKNQNNQKLIWDQFKVKLLKIISDTRNTHPDVYVCVTITYNVFTGQPAESSEMNDAIVLAVIKCFCNQSRNGSLLLSLRDTELTNYRQQLQIHYNSFIHLFLEYLLTQYPPFTKFIDMKLEEKTRLFIYKYVIGFLNNLYLKSDRPINMELFTSVCKRFKERSNVLLQNCVSNNIHGDANAIYILIEMIATLSWIEPNYYYCKSLAEDIDLFVTVCGLLKGLHEFGKPAHKNPTTNNNNNNNNNNGIVLDEHEIFYQLKIFLIQIIGNTSFKNQKLQDLARETEAIHTVFECTDLDVKNPICSFASAILCARIPGLSYVQRQLCTESPDAIVALGVGHILGAQECQHQFKGHRWNCTQVWKKDVFGQVVIVGSKEAAYTYAISSAGAVHAITSACARGNISLCGCDSMQRMTYREQSHAFKWGGCSADIGFGMKYARKFLDAREIEGDARSLMNLHNNRAGRKIVKNLLRTDCKCHGVSGSCAMKTCWKSLPPFRSIGDFLYKKYNKARFVQTFQDKNGLSLVIRRRGRQILNLKRIQRPKRMELVHLQASPNYCEKDYNLGSLGTSGRTCNRTARDIDGCDLLCCGRGYNTHQINRTWQCHCKFQWCCNVQCDICHERIEQYTCK